MSHEVELSGCDGRTQVLPSDDNTPAAPDRPLSVLMWLIPFVLWGFLRMLLFEGIQGADDLEHLRYAWELDRIPATHWELRLPYNFALAASLRVFGFSELSAALPGLLGSLMTMLFCGMTVRYVSGSDRLAMFTMVLLAVLPGDVLDSTCGGSTRVFGTGFLALALWCLATRSGRLSIVAAGVAFGLAVDCHLTLLFFVVVFFGGLGICVPALRARIALAWILGGTLFLLLDPLPWWILTGDPLYRLHVIEKTHLSQLDNDTNERRIFTDDGHFDSAFVTRPLRDFAISKQYAVLPLLMLFSGFAAFRTAPHVIRGVLFAGLAYWTYMAFGTHTPTAYKPFPGTVSYWQPLAVPLGLVIGVCLPALHRRWLQNSLAAGTVALCLLLMSLSGTWGQNVEISRQFLAWLKAHPDTICIADDRTAREIRTLNAFRNPPNLRLFPESLRTERWGVPCLRPSDMTASPMHVLINVLNNPATAVTGHHIPDNAASYKWLTQHSGKNIGQTTIAWRPIASFLPQSMRPDSLIRRPAGRIHEYVSESVEYTTTGLAASQPQPAQ